MCCVILLCLQNRAFPLLFTPLLLCESVASSLSSPLTISSCSGCLPGLITDSAKTNGDNVAFSHSKKTGYLQEKRRKVFLAWYTMNIWWLVSLGWTFFLKLIQTFPLSLDSFALGIAIFVVPEEYPWICQSCTHQLRLQSSLSSLLRT